jgi:hypothetical protein
MSQKTSRKNLLDNYQVKSPCNQSWGNMLEGGKGRFCLRCEKSVHNLSEMTKPEAFEFLEKTASPCVRYTKNHDGSVVFRQEVEPQGSSLVNRWREYMARSAVVASLLFAGCEEPTNGTHQDTASFVDGLDAVGDPGLTWDTVVKNRPEATQIKPRKNEDHIMGKMMVIEMGVMKAVPEPEPTEVIMGDMAPIPETNDDTENTE